MSSAFFLIVCSYLVPTTPPEVARAPVPAPDTVVICAPALRRSLQPWVDYRTAQGHRLRIVTQCDSASAIRSSIRSAAQEGGLRFVVMVGDVQVDAANHAFNVPTHLAEARINTRWGSEPEIATDNWFADLDDDGLPDLAIGRIPADSPDELSAIIKKIVRYERAAPGGIWRRRVNLIAGIGGFGILADTVIETATRSFIRRGIPEGYRTSMTYASWRSPYCPDPRAFRQQTIQRMNEGCLCWVYMGHGQRQDLDWVRVPLGVAPILTMDDVHRVSCPPGAPIALFLSCYGAAFDGPEDCLAEGLLSHPQGPVAVIGASRVTMPYGMAVLAQRMMYQMFQDRAQTLGEMMLTAKRETLRPPAGRPPMPWLDAIARAISPNPNDLEGELREHVLMFHLLGDPLTRLTHAQHIDVDVPRSARPGEPLVVKCRSDVAGDCTVELVCRRGRFTFKPKPRVQFDGSHEGMRELTRVYHRANDDRFNSRQFRTSTPDFETTLSIPPHVEGACAVRVFVQGAKACALGAAVLYVSQPEEPEPASPGN